MLGELQMGCMRRGPETWEDDWDATSDWLTAIQDGLRRHKEALLWFRLGDGSGFPGDDCSTVEQDFHGCTLNKSLGPDVSKILRCARNFLP